MSISRAFYLAASINQAMGHHEVNDVLKQYSTEHPENKQLSEYIGNGMRPGGMGGPV